MYDVAVIGGGVAGLCAAIQAGRLGARTLLVERSGISGGTLTMGGINNPGLFNAWGRQVIAGIGWDLVRRTRGEMGEPLPDFAAARTFPGMKLHIRVDPVIFAALSDRALLDAGVEIHYHTMLADLAEEPDAWRLTLCGKDGLAPASARIVIDCTGDANAAVIAGYECRRPSPCQPGTYSVRAVGYELEKLDFKALAAAYDRAVADGRLTAEDSGWTRGFNAGFLWGHGWNSNHIVGINAADSAGRTRIEIAGRESLLRIYRFLRAQPGLEKLRFVPEAGECGVRESRTIVGEATVTAEEYYRGFCYPDAICHSFYQIDLHDAEAGLDKRDLPEGTVPTVPRGALIPRGSSRFLAAGRIISGDRLANSALRVQATCMATGQAAGCLAALAARDSVEPGKLELGEARETLRKHGAIVPQGLSRE